MEKQIVYYYQHGVASYLIAKKFGLSNHKVRNILTKHGIKLRGHDVTNKVSADRRTPEENRAITKKAAQANKGSEHSMLHRSRLAIARERNPLIDPVYEQPLVDLCIKRGISIIPQKAFNKFNVDLYLPKENVVIEIFGGNFHNKKEAVDLFNNKIKYLSKLNIPVVVVWSDKLTFDPEKVLAVSREAKKKLTVLNGDGTPTLRGMKDIIL